MRPFERPRAFQDILPLPRSSVVKDENGLYSWMLVDSSSQKNSRMLPSFDIKGQGSSRIVSSDTRAEIGEILHSYQIKLLSTRPKAATLSTNHRPTTVPTFLLCPFKERTKMFFLGCFRRQKCSNKSVLPHSRIQMVHPLPEILSHWWSSVVQGKSLNMSHSETQPL